MMCALVRFHPLLDKAHLDFGEAPPISECFHGHGEKCERRGI
jgi:hypothetical protein